MGTPVKHIHGEYGRDPTDTCFRLIVVDLFSETDRPINNGESTVYERISRIVLYVTKSVKESYVYKKVYGN